MTTFLGVWVAYVSDAEMLLGIPAFIQRMPKSMGEMG